jgi:hypothetical protein
MLNHAFLTTDLLLTKVSNACLPLKIYTKRGVYSDLGFFDFIIGACLFARFRISAFLDGMVMLVTT